MNTGQWRPVGEFGTSPFRWPRTRRDQNDREFSDMDTAESRWLRDEPILRRTGITPLTLLPWGSHICMFYETIEDLLETQAGYFGAGLADNDCCVWAMPEPIDHSRALAALRKSIPGFDAHLAKGAFQLLAASEWYLNDNEFDARRVIGSWHAKLEAALANGFAGLRVSGNAFWMDANIWQAFSQYETELSNAIAGTRMLVLCTYALDAARAADFLAVAQSHHFSIVRRQGEWEFLEAPGLAASREEIDQLTDAMNIGSRPFPGHELLTPRERTTLAEIVRGASNKEAARALGISPRTVEFHRANIMRKLDVRNVAELLGIVLAPV
jgi:DNA-binding CsgD family transcriptional regulator